MKPGSLPSLSPTTEKLLSAEREILRQPELVRKRAQLRARTALWRSQQRQGAAAVLISFWRPLRLLAAVALLATSGVAAWLTLGPASSSEPSSAAVENPALKRTAARAPLSKTRAGAPTELLPQPVPQSQAGPGPAAPPVVKRAAPASRQSVKQRDRSRAAQELGLLDSARRAVASDDFRLALTLIERHANSFPTSQLREEREALRVRALKGAGLSKQADEAASRFESRYPNSVLAPTMNESGKTQQ